MNDSLSDTEIIQLYNKYKSKFNDMVSCLVFISFNFGIKQKRLKNLNFSFSKSTFRRRKLSYLKGDGEGKVVFFILFFMFFIIFMREINLSSMMRGKYY
jgi:hypothetical protein